MRWFTLVFSVTLFYSLSFVNAIPHDVDEKRHWLHKRQGVPGSSAISIPVVPDPSPSGDPGESSSVVSPTPPPSTPRPSSRSSSSSSSTPRPSSTPSPESSSTVSSSSSSTSSSSSSSSSPSSSTSSRTSSSSSSTITSRSGGQDSTSYRRFSSTRGLPSDTLSAEGNVQTGNGSGSSFLKNKAAMGSTFAIVGLVGVAIIIGTIFFLVKKARKRRSEDELETYFEKLPRNNSNAGNQQHGGNDYGLGPSATDLTSPASDRAYVSRDVHYGATGQYPDQFTSYNGFEYPPERGSVIERPVSYAPGTAYAAAMSQRGQYNYEGQVEDPNMVPNHPFADPNNRRY